MDITFEISAIIVTIAGGISAIVGWFVSSRVAKSQRMIEIITSNRVKWMQEVKDLFSEYFKYTNYYFYKSIPENNQEWFEKLNEVTSKIKLQLNLKGEKDQNIIMLIEELNKSYEKLLMLNTKLSIDKNIEDSIDDEIISSYITSYTNIKQIVDLMYKKQTGKEINKSNYKIRDSEQYKNMAKGIILMDIKISNKCIKNVPKLIDIYIKIYLKCEWERVKREAKNGVDARFNFDEKFESIEKELEKEINNIKKEILYNEWTKYGRE
ncbi:hypothetical protein [Clostridium saudiense]|uniref:hypothetical protein n=1 Tax=Clostridium saudiense TaxID=1414720 RepID=UPI003266F412